jgi:dsDNA-binding SOS-regulon protein
MSIKLEYILKRNKSNLKIFIQKNKLTTYDKLLEYCDSRKFIPCTENEYEEVVKKEAVQDGTKKVSGQASEAQKPKKRRYRRKKQQDTSKLPDSPDEG